MRKFFLRRPGSKELKNSHLKIWNFFAKSKSRRIIFPWAWNPLTVVSKSFETLYGLDEKLTDAMQESDTGIYHGFIEILVAR